VQTLSHSALLTVCDFFLAFLSSINPWCAPRFWIHRCPPSILQAAIFPSTLSVRSLWTVVTTAQFVGCFPINHGGCDPSSSSLLMRILRILLFEVSLQMSPSVRKYRLVTFSATLFSDSVTSWASLVPPFFLFVCASGVQPSWPLTCFGFLFFIDAFHLFAHFWAEIFFSISPVCDG